MNYWLVIHDINAYDKEPNLIGKEFGKKHMIAKITRGDRIVYYAMRDSVIIGTFDVTSRAQKRNNVWDGKHEFLCYSIKPRKLALRPHYLGFKDVLRSIPISKFPDGILKGSILMHRTILELTKEDFRAIEKFIDSNPKIKPKVLFNGPPRNEDLGPRMDNLEILEYAPTSEPAVVVLFAKFLKRIPHHEFVSFKFIRKEFPDACVLEKTEKGRLREKYIEFEFKSRNFYDHHVKNKRHINIKCDYIVCWEHDWPACPVELEVIELKGVLKQIGVIK